MTDAITSLHKASQELKAVAEKFHYSTDEYRAAFSIYLKHTTLFKAKYGVDRLVTFNMYSTLKSRLKHVPGCTNSTYRKLQNSKGNYGIEA